jgi:hypothetical protein
VHLCALTLEASRPGHFDKEQVTQSRHLGPANWRAAHMAAITHGQQQNVHMRAGLVVVNHGTQDGKAECWRGPFQALCKVPAPVDWRPAWQAENSLYGLAVVTLEP